jgi:hypothetical protein
MPKRLPEISWGSTLPVWEGGTLTRQRSFPLLPLLLLRCKTPQLARGEKAEMAMEMLSPGMPCLRLRNPVDFPTTCAIIIIIIIESRRGRRGRGIGRGRGRRGRGARHFSCLQTDQRERALSCASSGRGRLAQGQEATTPTARGSTAGGSTRALAAPGAKGGG